MRTFTAVALGALFGTMACSGNKAASSTSGTAASSGGSSSGAASSTTGGSSSSGTPYAWDGGALSCDPPPGFQGNDAGIGAYCDESNLACPGNATCPWMHGYTMYNFCVYTPCDTTQSSAAQCGAGTCCVQSKQFTMNDAVCVPTGCLAQFDAGTCPMP